LREILYSEVIEEQNMGERYIFTIRQLTKTYNKKIGRASCRERV